MFALSLSPQVGLVQQQAMEMRCDICGAAMVLEDEGVMHHCHWDCPEKVAARLFRHVRKLREQVNIRCVKCLTGKLGVNRCDFFECRSCKAQYCRRWINGETIDNLIELIDRSKDNVNDACISAYLLSKPGKGDFPENDFSEQLKEVDRVGKAIKRELRKQRYWLGNNHVYFNGEKYIATAE